MSEPLESSAAEPTWGKKLPPAAHSYGLQSLRLRPYQLDIVNRVEAAPGRSILVVLATGAGKTAIAEALTQREPGRVVFLADRKELVDQAHERLGGGVVMGARGTEGRVTVASVATLARRETRPPADLVFVDESHLYMAASYRKVVDAYRGSGARVVGLTATPARLDGQGLGELFDAVVEGPSMTWLVEHGYLVPVRTYAPQGKWWDNVAVRAGDFKADDLAEAATAVVRDVAGAWQRLGGASRPTVVFACTKKHAAGLAPEFPGAVVVTDDTPRAERAALKTRMTYGEVRVAISVGILGMGFDLPLLSCVVMARPTLSWSLYRQQAGRGTRIAPGKEDLLLVDCAGNALRHGLISDPFPIRLHGVHKVHRRALAGLVNCTMCLRVYAGLVCPGCGLEKKPVERRIRVVDGQLVELTGAQSFAQGATPGQQVRLLAKWVRLAVEKGWKPGAAAARFKGMFHRWPTSAERAQAEALQ